MRYIPHAKALGFRLKETKPSSPQKCTKQSCSLLSTIWLWVNQNRPKPWCHAVHGFPTMVVPRCFFFLRRHDPQPVRLIRLDPRTGPVPTPNAAALEVKIPSGPVKTIGTFEAWCGRRRSGWMVKDLFDLLGGDGRFSSKVLDCIIPIFRFFGRMTVRTRVDRGICLA